MAIFHMSVKVISRGKGQSAIAAAAYRSGERLRDEQADEQKFYTDRAERILFTNIMAPKDAPEWAFDRNQLWNNAERTEKRKDAQLAREFEVSLPHELTEEQREWLVKDFAREQFVRKGYAVDIAIHAPNKDADERNHHAHMMVTMRRLGPEGFVGEKDRSLNSREQMNAWREEWAHLANRHLERHGHAERIDHRSHKARGIEDEPTIHVGYAANEMAARGAQSDRMDQLQAVLARNEIRAIEADLVSLEHIQAKHRAAEADRARAEAFKAEAKAAGMTTGELALTKKNERQDAYSDKQQEAWRKRVEERDPDKQTPKKLMHEAEHKAAQTVKTAGKGGLKVIDVAGKVAELGDFMVDLLAAAPGQSKTVDLDAFVIDPAARKEQQIARLAAQEQAEAADKAIERIADDMKAGKALSTSDIKALTPAHHMQIRNFGDDGVRQIVDDAQKRAQEYWKDGGRERERD
jgi:ATP-dependent exoDNAse (exonuclease V) alpha subunit